LKKEKLIRNFKSKILKEVVIGPFCKTCDPAFIECMGHSGFDFVIIDMEHGPTTVENAQNLIRTAQLSGIPPLVRVKEDTFSLIGSVLDIGAAGVLVPHVNTSDDLKRVLENAKFDPAGQRGVCRYVRAADYSSMEKKEYFKLANENLIIIQAEGLEAIKNIEDIISIGGFEILFIGTYDLSQSLGVIGQVGHRLVREKMAEVIEKCRAKNIAVGSFADTVEEAEKMIDMGIKFISISVDVGIFYEACRDIVTSLSKIKKV